MSLTVGQRKILERRLHEERDRALSLLNRGLAERAGASEQDRAGDLTLLPFHPADLGTDAIGTDSMNILRSSVPGAAAEAVNFRHSRRAAATLASPSSNSPTHLHRANRATATGTDITSPVQHRWRCS
jgi:hypothetical protein